MAKCRTEVVNDLSRSLISLDMGTPLIVVVEMGQFTWIPPGVEDQPLKRLGVAGCPAPAPAAMAG